MILPKLDYRRVRSVKEAFEVFEKYKGNAVYLAGGTDLIPRIKLRLKTPSLVIDIKQIEEMKGVREKDGSIAIGSNTTIFELKRNETIKRKYPCLHEAACMTSCETLQMRGTIGGNVLQETRCLFYNKSLEWRRAKGYCYKMGGTSCHAVGGKNVCFANYLSDLSPALLSLDARVVLYGKEGERRCKLEEIFTGKSESPFNLKDGEIVKEIEISEDERPGAFEKLRVRGSIDYAIINGAISLNGKNCILVIGAVGAKPLKYVVEDLNGDYVEGLIERVYQDLKPVANTVLSPIYIKKMGKVIARRLIEKMRKGV